ncbi:hypothetical protein FKM82_006360 [Ascaphus truei]
MNSDSEDEGNNEEVEYEEEEPQIVNSVNKEGGDGMEQINGDISVKEEEDTDVNKDNQSQAEDSLPRPTSSRLLEKMSTPTESEKKEYVAVA